jgi:hypothetical protein
MGNSVKSLVLIAYFSLMTCGCVTRTSEDHGHDPNSAGTHETLPAKKNLQRPKKSTHLSLAAFRDLPEFRGRLVALDVIGIDAPLPVVETNPLVHLTIVKSDGQVIVVDYHTDFRADFTTIFSDLLARDRVYPHDLFIPRTIE